MIDERFVEGSSWLHQLDPRLKLIVAIIFSFTIALSNNLLMLIQVLTLAMIILITARLEFKTIIKRILVVNTFILFIWLFIPFTFPGEELFKLGPLTGSKEGIIYALKITIRSNSILLLIIGLLSTSSMTALIHAMNNLYLPDKLIYLFFFIYRYLFVLKEEYDRLYTAMIIRAFRPKTNLHTYKSYGYLIGMFLLKSYQRAENVYDALLCRGFKGKFYNIDDFNLDKYDIAFAIISMVIIFWCIYLERGWRI